MQIMINNLSLGGIKNNKVWLMQNVSRLRMQIYAYIASVSPSKARIVYCDFFLFLI